MIKKFNTEESLKLRSALISIIAFTLSVIESYFKNEIVDVFKDQDEALEIKERIDNNSYLMRLIDFFSWKILSRKNLFWEFILKAEDLNEETRDKLGAPISNDLKLIKETFSKQVKKYLKNQNVSNLTEHLV